MIRSFKCKETARIFDAGFSRKFPVSIMNAAIIHLAMLNNSGTGTLNDLKILSSNHLEKLYRDRRGQYSIRINNRYRVCFTWSDNNAYSVEIVDYH